MGGSYRDEKGGERVAVVNRGAGFTVGGMSGVIAAALAQDSLLFAVRADPALFVALFVEHLHLAYTTIVAYTTPITAARRLAIYRASGAAATGGTALTPAAKDTGNLVAGGKALAAAGIADARIATTAALGAAGVVREANPIGQLTLSHVGAAGNFAERFFEWHASWNAPIVLNPGELLVISNPVAMDAAGTFQIAATASYTVADKII